MIVYVIMMNILGLGSLILDKQKAKKRQYRLSESMLLTIALLGGSMGTYIGMYLVHHKTRKPKFYLGVPFIIIIQLIIVSQLLL